MTARIRFAPLFLLTAAVLTIGACGGASAGSPDDAPAATQSNVAGAPASDVPASEPTGDAAEDPAGASDITVTGAVEVQMKKTGICGMNELLPGTFELAFDNTAKGFEFYGDDLWLLQITIRGYEGAKTFETAEDSSGKAAFDLTDMMGTHFVAQQGDTFTIDAGERSGSMDATLVNEDSGETVSVKGTFTCEPA